MSRQLEIKKITDNINAALSSNQFPNYIDYIRFPFFKNLEGNARITFEFPLTVLTGVNGSGKSSALHALYGAPDGYSTGEFWFSTEVDPISSESTSCYIYGYKNALGVILEVLKTRVGTAKGSDYWEPSRPLKKYGMIRFAGGKRNKPIKKNVIYLDFRSELSAFDKYFYFANFVNTKTLKSKQDVLRKYSKHVKEAIANNKIVTVFKRKNKLPISLSAGELKTIAAILGKSYSDCKVLEHDFYGNEGSTVYFNTRSLNYSEAFAGRGEFAVVKLVNEITNAPNGSLILLDEPEVSLHPRAQEELKIFLMQSALSKKLQIVISTHSSKLIEFLPDNAIKLFYENSNFKFEIKNKCNYIEAFLNIGMELSPKDKNILIVEDLTAKLILEEVLKELGPEFEILFSVRFFSGGAEEIYKKAATYSEEGEKHKYMLLDGDKTKLKFDPNNFTVEEAEDFTFLKNKIKEVTNIEFEKIGFRIDGNSKSGGGNIDQKKEAIKIFLKYLFSNMNYFPGSVPEELIWDETFTIENLKASNSNVPQFTTDFKQNIMNFAISLFGDASEASITSIQKLLIKQFIRSKGRYFRTLTKILIEFKDMAQAK